MTSRPLAAIKPLRALTPPQRAAADRRVLARQQLLVQHSPAYPPSLSSVLRQHCATHHTSTHNTPEYNFLMWIRAAAPPPLQMSALQSLLYSQAQKAQQGEEDLGNWSCTTCMRCDDFEMTIEEVAAISCSEDVFSLQSLY